MIRPEQLREALASVPAGVTIVTTRDAAGQLCGFTASSFVSVSMKPPLVLICLNKTSSTFGAFDAANSYSINILKASQRGLAAQFAGKGDRFKDVRVDLDASGTPVLPDSLVSIVCSPYSKHVAGDHLLLIGQVDELSTHPGDPLVHCARRFWGLRLPSPDMAPESASCFAA